MSCKRKTCCCGSISPVKATDDMTQDVGIRDGQLYTKPGSGGGSSVNPVPKTSAMTQPVGVDATGKLFTKPNELIMIHDSVIDYWDLIGTDTHFHFIVRDEIGFDHNDVTYTLHGVIYVSDNNKIYGWATQGDPDAPIFVELENVEDYWCADEIY